MTPRLFLDSAKLNEIRTAITNTPGSHHQRAFEAIKARVDQNDWRVYDEYATDGNWNYARAWLAREASFVYQITGDRSYAQIAYNALYDIHNDPDPDQRIPDNGYGLSRAATGMGFALAYDWAASGWTTSQQNYVRQKILTSLDAWPSYWHPNFASPYGSNWVAVSRAAELVMMLSVEEEVKRADRFRDLKFWLGEHIEIAYGDTGFTQEGQGYLAYAGGFLMPAIYALRSIGDTELENVFNQVSFEQLPLYTGVFDAEQTSLQFGVGWIGFDPEGWSSFLLDTAYPNSQPYYQYFYDRYRGLANPASDDAKFDHRRGGTVWSVIYYPTDTRGIDPTGILPVAIQDTEKGSYLFRNRWKDSNDILISLMGDFTHHPRSWDSSEAFSLGLHAYDTHYFGGPTRENDSQYYSKLIVDGQVGHQTLTGAPEFFEARSTGGYVIVDGGSAYESLGIDEAKRHMLVDFSGNAGSAIISTLDRLADVESHIYTWQVNLGTYLDDGGITVTAGQEGRIKTFLLEGNNDSYLKGWILNPSNATVIPGDPLQIETRDSNMDIWVVMVVGTGVPLTADVTGFGLNSELRLGNARVFFDSQINQIVTEIIPNPGPDTSIIAFSEANYQEVEGSHPHQKPQNRTIAQLIRTGDTSQRATVEVSLDSSPGTATANSDYINKFSFLVGFAPGQTIKNIRLPIYRDNLFEDDETIRLKITNPQGDDVVLGEQTTATYTIINDDFDYSTLNLSIEDLTFVEGSALKASVKVSLSEAAPSLLLIPYQTTNDSAVANEDYKAQTGKVTFKPGEQTQVISILIPNNNQSEIDKQFTINLGVPNQPINITDSQGIVTITDTLVADDQTLILPPQVENLRLEGNANLDGIGNRLNNQITGNRGNNFLQGDAGNDLITGDRGNDILVGNAGDDLLTGDAGRDQFRFETGKSFKRHHLGIDTITDFSDGDRIVLSKTTFNTLDSILGNGFSDLNDFAIVASDAEVANSNAMIVFSKESSTLFYNSNREFPGLGIGSAFAILPGVANLRSDQFIIDV